MEEESMIQDMSRQVRELIRKYDGIIMLFIIVSFVTILATSGFFIWESLNTLKEFTADPLGFCQDLVWVNLAR